MDKTRIPNETSIHRIKAGVAAVINANHESVVLRRYYQKRDPRLAPNTRLYYHSDDGVRFNDNVQVAFGD